MWIARGQKQDICQSLWCGLLRWRWQLWLKDSTDRDIRTMVPWPFFFLLLYFLVGWSALWLRRWINITQDTSLPVLTPDEAVPGHTLRHSTPKAVDIEPTFSEKSPTDWQIFWRCVLVFLCCLWGSWVLECRLSSLIAAEDKEDDLMGRTVDEGGRWTPGFTSPPPLAPCCLHLSLTFCLVSVSPLPYSNGHWQLLIGGDKTQSWRWEGRIFTWCAVSEASHHCPTLKPGTALLPISHFLKGVSLRPGESSSLLQGLTWWCQHTAQQQVWSLSTFYSIFCRRGCPGTHYATHTRLENIMFLLYPPEFWELLMFLKSWVPKLEHVLALLEGLLRHKLGSSLLYFWLAGPGKSWRIWFQQVNRCGWYEVTVDAQWSCKTLGGEGAYSRATHRALISRALICCCP